MKSEELKIHSKAPFIAWPYVDTLYDYTHFLRQGPIATLSSQKNERIAIIGAGAAGLVAAYELHKIGLQPTIFEASDRIGGRCYTRLFETSSDTIAEMGAMRFPISSRTLFYYLAQLGIPTTDTFPNPGQVPTLLHFQNQSELWRPGTDLPGEFYDVQREWRSLIRPLVDRIYAPWRQQHWAKVRAIWQEYTERYDCISFYQVLLAHGWTEKNICRFGALGIGTGGFDSLYQISFLEILRIIINQLETDQRQIKGGTTQFLKALYTATSLPDGSLRLNHTVTNIAPSYDNAQVALTYQTSAGTQTEHYAAVIVATTTHAMEKMGLATTQLLKPEVAEAIRHIHMIASSKMFIRTATKFWRGNATMPQVILTDELPRAVYALDYGGSTQKEGVICMSYTWGDSASKFAGMDATEQFSLCKQVLQTIYPQFAAHLIPVNNQIFCIDWQAAPGYFGAFKLPYPGQEHYTRSLYYQFLSVLDQGRSARVYLAGDGVSWNGGWLEGALQTGINAACAVAKRLNGTLAPTSPLSQRMPT